MIIPTPIKVLTVIGLTLWGCFEVLNILDSVHVKNNFFKNHNATVESVYCRVPVLSLAVIDRSMMDCTFRATPEQIKVLVKNLDFCPINPVEPTDEIPASNYGACIRQSVIGEKDPETLWKDYDEARSASIEKHTCWNALGLNNRSELELYGAFSDKESQFSANFYVLYARKSRTGCVRFVTTFR